MGGTVSNERPAPDTAARAVARNAGTVGAATLLSRVAVPVLYYLAFKNKLKDAHLRKPEPGPGEMTDEILGYTGE